MVCTAETAEVLLSNNGETFFKPTCVGTASHTVYSVKNISRMPLEFRWSIPYNDNELIRVSPPSGLILPNESQVSLLVPSIESGGENFNSLWCQ